MPFTITVESKYPKAGASDRIKGNKVVFVRMLYFNFQTFLTKMYHIQAYDTILHHLYRPLHRGTVPKG